MKRVAVKAAPEFLYFFYCWVMRTLWRLRGGTLEVQGVENVPISGACIVVSNHQSYLDPIFLHAAVPRVLHAMAKSTQFASPFMGWFLAHIYVFPVRRYEVDPQAVRTVLRRLQAGHAVMIYPEGERSWDGRFQNARRGTVRLLLKAGVPVIPCRIHGSYEVWPRWDRRVQPATVRVTFGKPLPLPVPASRADRELALPAAIRLVEQALA